MSRWAASGEREVNGGPAISAVQAGLRRPSRERVGGSAGEVPLHGDDVLAPVVHHEHLGRLERLHPVEAQLTGEEMVKHKTPELLTSSFTSP